jgi:ubiquinone/menaquinone biosynthesis C-methylase UbiE
MSAESIAPQEVHYINWNLNSTLKRVIKMNNFWEEEVYAKGNQVNLYPFPQVLTRFSKIRSEKDISNLKVLEIGCGTGNNSIALAKLGFKVFGCDISNTAIEKALNYAKTANVMIEFIVSDVANLQYPDSTFDYVLDRGVLTCLRHNFISKAISEIYRILRQDGVYLGFDWFGEKESNLHYGEPVSGDLGSSFTKFSEGDFHNVEYISPVNPEVVQRYFNEFRTIKYNREILLDSQEEIIKDKYHLECAK